MKYRVIKPDKNLFGSIDLITSKSISNRLLVIQALQKGITIHQLSESEDTKIMQAAFNNNSSVIDAGHAGTAMRFLTAYLANTPGEKILTGSDRMKNRPISILVEALQKLGAHIEYTEKQGFPPLRIKGKQLEGGSIFLDGSVSSQYITALLLIAPTFKKGLEIELTHKVSSKPYIDLTIELMKYFGAEVFWDDNFIYVKHGNYQPKAITVEADWSAASYWYQMTAFSDEVNLTLTGLLKQSLQGDSVTAEIFKKFGVETRYKKNAIVLSKKPVQLELFEFDFIHYPDLVQTMVVTCVMLNIPFKISGAQSLRIKETDRIAALQIELKKYGVVIQEPETGMLTWDGTYLETDNNTIEIETYVDHRMALAFAPIAIIKGEVIIKNPQVVEKSYPEYWSDLQKVGFEIETTIE